MKKITFTLVLLGLVLSNFNCLAKDLDHPKKSAKIHHKQVKIDNDLDSDSENYNSEYIINDPFEKVNRAIFKFNKGLDIILIKPLAKTYKAIPKFGRDRIHNFLQNLTEPIVFLNGLLQLNPKLATTALSRFVINSFIGLGGIHDVAANAGVPYQESNFNATLFHYNVGTGPYIMLPILGSSSGRGVTGLIVDIAADPFTYIFETNASIVRFSVSLIDRRTNYLDATDHIEKSSIDEYATYRSIYSQKNINYKLK